ncbi:MAG: glycoside hydrolase [Cytophagales bacterium]|nr:glycoside hydrolase [Armatimonadota bacterium]
MTKQTILIAGGALLVALCGAVPFAGDAAAQPAALPGQPFAPYWFPNDLLRWSPGADPDAEYNRSRVPLADRFHDPKTQSNPHARPGEARVASLAAFGSTSRNPSQGEARFATYTAAYWQYVDVLIYWGGSAGEGLVIAPKPTVTDAAHRNGVPVLGTIFFPPVVYGGRLQWVRDLVQKKGDRYPVADKLIETANYYGFDGWFFNQETDGADAALAAEYQRFLRYLQKRSRLRIMWYDAMNKQGLVGWQGALNSANQPFFDDDGLISDDLFIDFRWRPARLTASRDLALQLRRNPYDLYAGVDVEGAGYNKAVPWESLFPENQPHTVSLGFYRPEWTFNTAKDTEEFYQKDSHFWVGAKGDPSNTQTSEAWKGVAHYIPEQSPITRLPFVTSFNTGQGHLFAVDGAIAGRTDWNNLSLQDVLPTWRWSIASPGSEPLRPAFDWTEAYNGGTSLKVSGVLRTPNQLRLYSTRLLLPAKTRLRITYKTGQAQKPTRLQVGLTFADNPSRVEYLDVGSTKSAEWGTTEFALSQFASRTLAAISLRFASSAPVGDYSIFIGEIAVLGPSPIRAPASPLEPRIEKRWDSPGRASLRLRWTPPAGPVARYQVYRRHADGTRVHLGGTPNQVYFVSAVERVGAEREATLLVEAVGPTGVRSKPAVIPIPWPKP